MHPSFPTTTPGTVVQWACAISRYLFTYTSIDLCSQSGPNSMFFVSLISSIYTYLCPKAMEHLVFCSTSSAPVLSCIYSSDDVLFDHYVLTMHNCTLHAYCTTNTNTNAGSSRSLTS